MIEQTLPSDYTITYHDMILDDDIDDQYGLSSIEIVEHLYQRYSDIVMFKRLHITPKTWEVYQYLTQHLKCTHVNLHEIEDDIPLHELSHKELASWSFIMNCKRYHRIELYIEQLLHPDCRQSDILNIFDSWINLVLGKQIRFSLFVLDQFAKKMELTYSTIILQLLLTDLRTDAKQLYIQHSGPEFC